MLMIGTSELAEACYEAWRDWERRYGPLREIPDAWRYLTTNQQRQWRAVAEAAAQKLVEAMGAAPRPEAVADAVARAYRVTHQDQA
jgi:hypothetical protein